MCPAPPLTVQLETEPVPGVAARSFWVRRLPDCAERPAADLHPGAATFPHRVRPSPATPSTAETPARRCSFWHPLSHPAGQRRIPSAEVIPAHGGFHQETPRRPFASRRPAKCPPAGPPAGLVGAERAGALWANGSDGRGGNYRSPVAHLSNICGNSMKMISAHTHAWRQTDMVSGGNHLRDHAADTRLLELRHREAVTASISDESREGCARG